MIITLGATLTRAPGTLDADTSWERVQQNRSVSLHPESRGQEMKSETSLPLLIFNFELGNLPLNEKSSRWLGSPAAKLD